MRENPQVLKTEPLPGFLLVFSAKEHAAIKEALEEWGYTGDSDGLKEFILDEVSGEEPHLAGKNLGSTVGDLLMNNPELVRAGGQFVSSLLKRRRK